MIGDEEDYAEWDKEDLIPGDNDRPVFENDPPLGKKDAPSNLTHILPLPGNIPVVIEQNP